MKKNWLCNAEETEAAEIPNCNACNQRGGQLQKAFANPASMAKWNKDKKLYKTSMFGRQICVIPFVAFGALGSALMTEISTVLWSSCLTHLLIKMKNGLVVCPAAVIK